MKTHTVLTGQVVTAALAVAVLALAGATLEPLWAPLAFAAWTASLLDPMASWLSARAGGRRTVGAVVCTALVLALLVPVGIALTSIVTSVVTFVRQLVATPATRAALEAMVSPDAGAGHAPLIPEGGVSELVRANLARLPDLARQHGATAWRAASGAAGAGAVAALTAFLFFVALFSFLRDGRDMWAWARRHAPMREETSERFARAFLEVGRGMIVGAGLTALTQAALATVIYLALGVPRAPVLGALTFVCAFVPAVGTAVVWGPVAVGLALKGQVVKAIVLGALGALGISSIDNVLRPLMQRWGGNLQLPAFVLLLAAFGGLAAFGPKGLILGPLSLRLSVEVLTLAREAREANGAREDSVPRGESK
jgi:predicted PurR-regulated permease PerM